MRAELIRQYLLPDAEHDPAFRAEMQRIAYMGVLIVGGLQAAVPLLMLAAGLGVVPQPATTIRTMMPNLAISLVGASTLLTARLGLATKYPRPLAGISVWLSSAVLEWCVLLLQPDVAWIEHYLIGHITLVKFGAATLPFKPLQTLVLGLTIDAWYLASWAFFRSRGAIPEGFGAGQHLFPVMITLGCAALTAVVYRQRATNFRTHQRALQAAEDLRRTQSRLMITENAASMGRLAAALSHELNSPIGVLSSAVDTLAAAASKAGTAGEPERLRLARVVEETRAAGRQSAERLRSLVSRMQRFTNLDRAEVQSVELNDLVRDVVALLDPEAKDKARIELQLQEPLPRFIGRPQQLSAVLSNLLGNALDAVTPPGRIHVCSRATDSDIELHISDNGRGITAEELENVFNPASFRVSGTRIAAGNWSLFSCRQIVQEHGGDVYIASTPGQGTKVTLRLPAGPGI